MTKVVDRWFPMSFMAITVSFICLIKVSGITDLVIGLAIIYVAFCAFYTGYKWGARTKVIVKH